MLLHLLHRTTFTYAGVAHDSFNEVRLRPVDNEVQACRQFTLRVEPDAPQRDYVDFHGNTVYYFDVVPVHRELVVEAESEIETVPDAERRPVPVVSLAPGARSDEWEMQAEFYSDSPFVPLAPELWKESQDVLAEGRTDLWSDVCRLGRHVHRTFAYKANVTGVSTLATDALKLRAGVCQDFAHVMLGLCRTQGIPARYVSGYFLIKNPRPGEVEASHAWVEAFIPGYGWAAYDPTHDRPANERYIKVAVGKDYGDIRPISGTYRGSPTRSLRVEVSVREVSALAAR